MFCGIIHKRCRVSYAPKFLSKSVLGSSDSMSLSEISTASLTGLVPFAGDLLYCLSGSHGNGVSVGYRLI